MQYVYTVLASELTAPSMSNSVLFERRGGVRHKHESNVVARFHVSDGAVASRICVLGITRQCNSRCTYCSCWRGVQEDMSSALAMRVIEQASLGGFSLIGFSGGEPLLHPELDRLIASAWRGGLWSTLTTNGILLSQTRVRALRDAGLTGLVVSLDTLDPDIYAASRGVSIGPTLAGLDAALEVPNAPILCVSSVLSAPTLPQLHELADFCLQRGVMLGITPLHNGRGVVESDEWSETPATAIHDAFAALRDGMARGLKMANTPGYLDALETLLLERRLPVGFTCRSVRRCMSISPDGVVQVCPEAPPIGDLREQNLDAIWDSLEHRRILKAAASGTCSGCWYSYRVETTLVDLASD